MIQLRCSVIKPDGERCRRVKDLTNVQIKPAPSASMIMPDKVVVLMCPDHFVMIEQDDLDGQDSGWPR